MTYWYDPDEIKYQADNAQIQPEFDPLHGEDDPLHGDENIRIIDDIPVEDDTLSDNVDEFVERELEIKAIVDGLDQ